MSESVTPQRRWQALCPGCGAPVEFASAASASAVCGYCRSTLLREGEALRRIGVSGELFDDHSPLQLGASGSHQGLGFTLVGRLQYRFEGGTWNEWHALFDGESGKSAWLSEDNGAYVLSFDQPPLARPPGPSDLTVGARTLIGGEPWSVASLQRCRLIAAQGELPRPPQLEGEFFVADLRHARGEVGTLDWADPAAPLWSVGRSVTLRELALRGLQDGPAEARLAGRTLACPSCGATLAPTLASTRSLSCGQCHAVVDLSQGAGADLAHYAQANSGHDGVGPQIPLGRTGRLAVGPEGALDWQVVGYQERRDLPDDPDEASTFWREYLLYHRSAGFAFLVDADEGWSVVRPITGVPVQRLAEAEWQGKTYLPRDSLQGYAAEVTWVQGEFYWQVRQGERAQVFDYRQLQGPGVLSCERSRDEVVWSAGRTLRHAEVAQAFGLAQDTPAAGDVRPTAGGSGWGLSQGLVVLLVVIAVMLLMARCDGSSSACDSTRQTFGESSAEYQQCLRDQRSRGGYSGGGGSFGGFSSGGGGHK